eukprot:533421_1
MFEISMCQTNICEKHSTRLVYKWTFIAQLIIITICNIYIKLCTITSSITIKLNMQYYVEKYIEMYNKNINNVYNITCFREYWYYTCIFCMLDWIKIAQMVQQVIINIFYYYNIIYVFILVLYFLQKSPYNSTTTLTITNQRYTTRTVMKCSFIIHPNDYRLHKSNNKCLKTFFSNGWALLNMMLMLQDMHYLMVEIQIIMQILMKNVLKML